MIARLIGLAATAAVVLGLAAPGAHADELARVKARGKLVVGVKNDYPPFGSLDAKGQVQGFEIDLAKFIAGKLLGDPKDIELVPVVASNRIELLNGGRIDLILATLGQNADRAKIIDFTRPYYMMAGIVLLAPKDTPIKRWEDVRGHTLCGIQGNLYNRTLEEKYGAQTRLFTGTAEMFKAFQDNRCEAIAFDGPILQQKVVEPGWSDKYKIALDTFDYIPIAGGVRKGEPAFLDAVNQAIVVAEAAGVLTHAEVDYKMGSSDYVTRQAAEAKAQLGKAQ